MRDLQADRGASLSADGPTGAGAGTTENPAAGPTPTRDGAPSGADVPTPTTSPEPPEPPDRPLRPRRGRWLLAVVAAVVLVADLLSKLAVVAKLEDTNHPPVEVAADLLYLVHTRNTGAAFSLGSSYTWVLTAIAVGVVVFILRTARQLGSRGWAVALGLVLGGAAGNLIDRLFRDRGGVVDFLALIDPYDPPWPVFNLADSALVLGVAVLVGLEFTGRRINGSRVRHSTHD